MQEDRAYRFAEKRNLIAIDTVGRHRWYTSGVIGVIVWPVVRSPAGDPVGSVGRPAARVPLANLGASLIGI